ncbi:MAG: RsmB/NOP family class I SAM-dependent RNA methyltransferase [Paracoccaceae bacterium]|nr:RsmB/NOP family class I SAM-dependent RNA methyltransferase [Paracoccaceae bacterium]
MSIKYEKLGLESRWAAVQLLNRVIKDGLPISNQLDSSAVFSGLNGADRARAQRLAANTLRQLGRIDLVLGEYLKRLPPTIPLNILRLAVFEICAEKTSPYAVVDSAVSLMKKTRKLAKFSGLANAVLRKISTTRIDSWESEQVTKLPNWLRNRLVSVYSEKIVNNIEISHMQGAQLDITLKPELNVKEWTKKLDALLLPTGSLRLKGSPQISTLPGYEEGMWWVQDAAAALPVKLLGTIKNKNVLDVCAAPGGKTLQIASMGANVTALDKSTDRLKLLRNNLDRTSLLATVVQTDFISWNTNDKFDFILLDAPCTATGTIRRHPDLPLLKSEKDLKTIIKLQATLIDRAVSLLSTNGRLVFSTCSLLPEEGELQIKAAIERHNLKAVTVRDDLLGLEPGWYNSREDTIRLRPDHWKSLGGLDGFFIVALERAS